MFCLSVLRNGTSLCSAGVEGASFLDVTVAGSVFGDHAAHIEVSGMKETPSGSSSHVYWVSDTPLMPGDVVRVASGNLPNASAPILVVPTDSPEYIEEQREYDEFLRAHVFPRPQPVETRTGVGLNIVTPGFPKIRAGLAIGHKHILCGVSWNMWRPERVRIAVRSFSGESKLHWMAGEIPVGESLCVEVRA